MNKPFNPNITKIDRMIRVNQAGEYGAVRIYKGQLAAIKCQESKELISHMLEQEEEHLRQFEKKMQEYKVRPTILSPVWHIAGYLLGYATAKLGKEAAMACTVAVEEVIDQHYAQQEEKLSNGTAPELLNLISKCREEENEHKETGLEHGAENALGYQHLRGFVRKGSKLAIWLSSRI